MELCPILGRDLHTLPKDYALIQGGNWLMCLLSRLSLESRFAQTECLTLPMRPGPASFWGRDYTFHWDCGLGDLPDKAVVVVVVIAGIVVVIALVKIVVPVLLIPN